MTTNALKKFYETIDKARRALRDKLAYALIKNSMNNSPPLTPQHVQQCNSFDKMDDNSQDSSDDLWYEDQNITFASYKLNEKNFDLSPNPNSIIGKCPPLISSKKVLEFEQNTTKETEEDKKSHLNEKTQNNSKKKVFECSQCSKSFNKQSLLVTHMRVHNGQHPFSCNFCPKKFTQMCNLKTHLRIHLGHRPYACKQCDKKFTQSAHLSNHVAKIHDEKKKISF